MKMLNSKWHYKINTTHINNEIKLHAKRIQTFTQSKKMILAVSQRSYSVKHPTKIWYQKVSYTVKRVNKIQY